MSQTTPRRTVIGVGNPDRGDDAAGCWAARIVRHMLPDDVTVVEHNGDATALVARLAGMEAAFLVDACCSGAACGTLHRFDVAAAPLPANAFSLSTHGFGLMEGIELTRILGLLPACCVVFGIEGGHFQYGDALSPPVCASLDEVARRLCAEIVGQEAVRA